MIPYTHILWQNRYSNDLNLWVFQRNFPTYFLEHTPDPQPIVNAWECLSNLGVNGEAWGRLQGYVGVLLEGFVFDLQQFAHMRRRYEYGYIYLGLFTINLYMNQWGDSPEILNSTNHFFNVELFNELVLHASTSFEGSRFIGWRQLVYNI